MTIGCADCRAITGGAENLPLVDVEAGGAGIEGPSVLSGGQFLLAAEIRCATRNLLADTVEIGDADIEIDKFFDRRSADTVRIRYRVDIVEIDVEIDMRAPFPILVPVSVRESVRV